MDPLLNQIVISGTGEAVKVMTEKLLSSREGANKFLI